MNVMEFSEETKVDFVRPDWADFMGEDDFISYMPSYTGGLYLDWFEEKLYKNEGQSIRPLVFIKFFLKPG